MPNRQLLLFVLRRLGAAILLLAGVTVVTFALTTMVPSNPVISALGEAAASDPATAAAYRKAHGLDDPLPVQYLHYVQRLLHGDLGVSVISGVPVRDELSAYLPATIELALLAALLAFPLGIAGGIIAAIFKDRMPDHAIRFAAIVGVSVPIFVLALWMYYVFAVRLEWFDGTGRLDPGMIPPPHKTGAYTVDAALAGQWDVFRSAVSHLVMPAVVLAIYVAAFVARFTRVAVVEALGEDFIQTARAKGLGRYTIAVRHAFRSALIPIVTVGGVVFAHLLAGTVFVEAVFGFNGIGEYAYESSIKLDLPAVMGVTLCVAVIFISINLVVDLLYGVIDPRIRRG